VRKRQRTTRCRPGGLCDFEVRLGNRGPGGWTGRPVFTDTLPPGANFVAATAPAICRQAGRTLTCRYPREVTMDPGETRRIVITLRMGNARAGLQNCAALADGLNPDDPNTNNDRMCVPVRVTPRPPPDIQAIKIQQGGDCRPGGPCRFDLWFVNRGPGNWRGAPVLTDQLPPGVRLRNQSAGWRCSQSGATLNCTHGTVTLRPMRAVKLTVTVQLPNNIAPNARNCARVGGTAATHDPVPQNNRQCITIDTEVPPAAPAPGHPQEPERHTPAPIPDQHGQPAPVHPQAPPVQPAQGGTEKKQLGPCKAGSSCLFEIKYSNRGASSWTGKARVADVLPSADITLGTWSPTSWRCRQNGRVVACEHSGATLAPNQNVSIILTLRLPQNFHGGPQNCAVADQQGVDPLHNSNRHCVAINTGTAGHQPRPPAVAAPPPPPAPPPVHQPAPPPVHSAQPPPPPATCPPGAIKRGDICYTCPKGYELRSDNKCHSLTPTYTCPRGYVLRGKQCYSTQRTCPRGYTLRGNRCYPPHRQQQRYVCPPGFVRAGRTCVRINVPRYVPRHAPRHVPRYVPRRGHGH
jgi:uncharacterized repeat protein (TIGR01451 family)